MANSLGSLRVSLGLDTAEFTAGLTKAQYQAKKFGEALGGGIRSAGMLAAGALAAVGVSAVGAVAGFNALINGAADFQDIAEKTGASAEALASFGTAAGTAGTTVATIGDAMNKLTKNLTGVDDESKAAGAALGALGLNLQDFKKLSPEAQIEAISKSLAGFADGPGKAAVSMALLGKSGAELLPFLKALDEQGGRSIIITAEQIAQADEYADKQAKAKAELLQYAQALATQALPAVTAVSTAVKDLIKEFVGGEKAQRDFANSGVLIDWAEKAALAIGTVAEAAVGVGRTLRAVGGSIESVYADTKFLKALTPTGTLMAALNGDSIGSLFKERQEKAKEANDRYVDLWNYDGTRITKSITKSFADQRAAAALARQENRGFTPNQKTLKFDGATKPASGGAGDDPMKKMLDNQLKAYENSVKEEEDILRSRNRMLDLYNSESLLSTADYFAGKRTAQEEAVNAQAALYDKEIAALEAYQSKAGKATDREAAQGKINDLTAKKTSLYREAAQAAVEMGAAEKRSAQALQDQLSSVNADVLELTGNLAAASKIRLDNQYRDLLSRLDINKDKGGIDLVNRLKGLKTAQIEYNAEQEKSSQILGFLQVQEDRLGIARQLGADTEFSSLSKLGDARRATLTQLESIVLAQEAIARNSGSDKLILQAQQARAAFEKLAAVSDPLADKFKTLFTDSLGNELADFITGTKSAEDAIKGFARTVINELSNIAAKNFASSLTSSIFGAGGASGGGFWSSIFGSIFGRASGGSVQAGGLYEVNENGPEMLSMGGKSYLMAGGNGLVSPMDGKLSSNGGATGDVILNISTPAGTAVTRTNQRRQGNDRVLDIVIEQAKNAVASDIASGGVVATAMQGTYGLNRGAGTARRG